MFSIVKVLTGFSTMVLLTLTISLGHAASDVLSNSMTEAKSLVLLTICVIARLRHTLIVKALHTPRRPNMLSIKRCGMKQSEN